jgi:hypothetical protein
VQFGSAGGNDAFVLDQFRAMPGVRCRVLEPSVRCRVLELQFIPTALHFC